jgi:chitin disaccharide deacetylase
MNLTLIVNADDYGMSRETNRGIERAHLAGIVTSTTVMANQAAVTDAVELRRCCPELGVGVHLTLTLGSPLSPTDTVRSLVDADGRLLRREALLSRLRSGDIVPSHVVTECVAQVRALRAVALEPDHWDVHQHLHEYPALGRPIAEAMLAEGVLRARNPRRARLQRDRRRPKALIQARRRAPMTDLIRRNFATPDLLFDASPARWGELIRHLPDGVIEAICHPAEPDDTFSDSTIDSAERVAELSALCDGRLRDRLAERAVQFATFHDALGSNAQKARLPR